MESLRRRQCDSQGMAIRFWQDAWRRQLLDGRHLDNLFGLTLFTIPVTFANLIQINVFPAAALTYLI